MKGVVTSITSLISSEFTTMEKSQSTLEVYHSKINPPLYSFALFTSFSPIFTNNSSANVIFPFTHSQKNKRENSILKTKHTQCMAMRAFFAIEKRCLIFRECTVNGCHIKVLLRKQSISNSLIFSLCHSARVLVRMVVSIHLENNFGIYTFYQLARE